MLLSSKQDKKNLIILIKVLHKPHSCHNTLGLAFQAFRPYFQLREEI